VGDVKYIDERSKLEHSSKRGVIVPEAIAAVIYHSACDIWPEHTVVVLKGCDTPIRVLQPGYDEFVKIMEEGKHSHIDVTWWR